MRVPSWRHGVRVLGAIGCSAATFTTSVIQVRVAPQVLVMPLALALTIGVLGRLAPAARAAPMRPIDALRKA